MVGSWMDVGPQTYWSAMKCAQKWKAYILKLLKQFDIVLTSKHSNTEVIVHDSLGG